MWRFAAAEFDEARGELRVSGQSRPIEAKPLAVLQKLLLQRGNVVTKEELKAAVWPGVEVVEQSLPTAVSKLRAALGDQDWSLIKSVRGKGYQIAAPVAVWTVVEAPRFIPAFRPGDPVPHRLQWTLERPLGSASARDVWLAQQARAGERRVFKFAETAARLEALKQEAALSRILSAALPNEPGFVPVIEWSFQVSPYFLESPYGGPNLVEWAATRGGLAAISLDERLALMARTARLAAAAHSVGVLHRDIKPSNVLVAEEGGGTVVRLVDFGSGRLTDTARLAALSVTGLGLAAEAVPHPAQIAGTLRYMAPEVLAGSASTIAADVYALGILLYQMIAGDLDRPLSAGWEADIADPLLRLDVMEAAMGDPARRLSSAALLAERLETVEGRRAELDRQQRQAVEHEQILRTAELRRLEAAASAERAAHAVQLARRTRAVAVASLLLCATATALSLYAFEQRIFATTQRDRAEQLTTAATAAVSGLVNDLAANLRDKAGVSMEAVQQVLGQADGIVARLAQFAPANAELQRLKARALAELSDTYLHQGDLAKSLDAAERAAAVQQSLLAAQPGNATLRRELAQSLRWAGDVKAKQRDFPGAMAAYQAVLGIITQLASADLGNADLQQRLARAELAVGDVQIAQSNNQGALATYQKAQAVIAEGMAAHPDDPDWQLDLSTAGEKVGDALDAMGDRRGALAAYRADLAIREHLVSLDASNTRWRRDVAVADSDVGDELEALGDPLRALPLYQTSAKIYRDLAALDPSNAQHQRDLADVCNDIGKAEADMGDWASAARSFQDGITIMQPLAARSLADTGFQQDLVTLETGLAKALAKTGDLPGAADHGSRALDMAAMLAGSHPLDASLAGDLEAARQVVAGAKPQ